MNPLPPLLAGDVLLYRSKGIVDSIICFRTFSDVAHIEIYMTGSRSAASRNGLGVNIYPLRLEGLQYIYRPVVQFNYLAAIHYVNTMRGTKYGWLDLINFYTTGYVRTKGVVCSQFGDELLRAGGVDAFPVDYPDGKISPRDFKIVSDSILKQIWKRV